jgi:hypothetical protein
MSSLLSSALVHETIRKELIKTMHNKYLIPTLELI